MLKDNLKLDSPKLTFFILAAGEGQRLMPITSQIPKPLIPVLGKPILQYTLDKLEYLNIKKIGLNLYYKKNKIKGWIKKSPYKNKIHLFEEQSILGTGGGLKNVQGFLRTDTFVVHNADILTDIDLQSLVNEHLKSGNIATLAIHNYHQFNNLQIRRDGYLKALKNINETKSLMAFTGIAIYQPDFLRCLPKGVSNITQGWLNAIKSGFKIGTMDFTGCYWTDIGTPLAYIKTVKEELNKQGENLYIHSSVRGTDNILTNGFVVIEKGNFQGCRINFKNCIVLQNPVVEGKMQFKNCIVGKNFTIHLKEKELSNDFSEDGKLLIGTGGSDRKYYRIKKNKKTFYIFLKSHSQDADFKRQIQYSQFFKKYLFPVPKLISYNYIKKEAIFEDLGDTSLYNWLKCSRTDEEIERIYKCVLDKLIKLHFEISNYVSECPSLANRIFDYEHFRWETNYFIERFINPFNFIDDIDIKVLDSALDNLAFECDSIPKSVIHRDCQSQNIMVLKNHRIKFIDYQGARIGPPHYDIASLLYDPYYNLKTTTRNKLIAYYTEKVKNKVKKFNNNEFANNLLFCRLQRHFQVLGAFSFLSKEKNKTYFLKYIPEGVRLLKEDLEIVKSKYPTLHTFGRYLRYTYPKSIF